MDSHILGTLRVLGFGSSIYTFENSQHFHS
uniref:Uncharacterized protein n=1 Tax=Rhizophora mucronata TaxID=61149 RepID=A0A2P2NHU6_RHIMU